MERAGIFDGNLFGSSNGLNRCMYIAFNSRTLAYWITRTKSISTTNDAANSEGIEEY